MVRDAIARHSSAGCRTSASSGSSIREPGATLRTHSSHAIFAVVPSARANVSSSPPSVAIIADTASRSGTGTRMTPERTDAGTRETLTPPNYEREDRRSHPRANTAVSTPTQAACVPHCAFLRY